MRAMVLIVLACLLPLHGYAASSPALTVYTVSRDTIYPTATADLGLATTTTIDVAFSERVKASIKILSASGALVKSLYTSSGVTNPTPKIWDGTDTTETHVSSGIYTVLVSATSTASELAMVDSSKTITVASGSSGSSSTTGSENSSDTADIAPSGSGVPEYLPIPTLHIVTSGTRTVSANADTVFTAVVYDDRGNKRDNANMTWSFGDGMRKVGASVFHKYYNPGEYLAVVHAVTSDGGDATYEVLVTVKNSNIKIVSVSARGIVVANNDTRDLDLSFWRLSMGGQEFKMPEDTLILAGRSILFASQVIELPLSSSASLLYPSGEVAASYPEAVLGIQTNTNVQPRLDSTSYKQVQAVAPPAVNRNGPIISTKANIQAHEEAVKAPTAADNLAAVGALPDPPENPASRVGNLFRSPWTLGFLGIVALAGGAFILL